ncbi:MAG: TRAP transporter large permease [Trueperaceae bacterium]
MILVLFGLLFALIAVGFSIWTAMGVSGAIYIVMQGEVSFRLVASRMVSGIDSETLVAIPFFILAGDIMNAAGITRRLADFADLFVGRFRAGLAYVSIIVSVIMAGVSGSAVADATSVSSVLHPIMRKRGYHDRFAAAINASSAVIGPIFPPSIPMIFIGVISGLSIGRLFLGGILPGLLMAGILWFVATLVSNRRGYAKAPVGFSWRRFGRLAKETLLALLAPSFVISGVVFGFVTITEVAAIAVAYVMFLGLFVYRTLTWSQLAEVFRRSALLSATLMAIFAVVGLFQYIVATEQMGAQLESMVEALNLGKNGFLVFTTIFFLLLGAILDAIPVMLIFFPVLLPIAMELGIDPTHFGVITVLNLMIGLLTPPIGVLLFIQTKIGDVGFGELLGEIWPYILALLGVLLLCTFVPAVVLWIPNLVF